MTQDSDAVSIGDWPDSLDNSTDPWGEEPLDAPGWGYEPLEQPSVDEDVARVVGERLIALAGGGQDAALEASIARHPAGSKLDEEATITRDLVYDVRPAVSGEHLPQILAADVSLVVRDWTDPDEVGPFASKLRAGVLDVVQQGHAALAARRPEGKPLTDALVAPELAYLGQTGATLKAVAEAILAGEKEARAIAGEVLVDVRGGDDKVRTGTVSAKVSDQHGGMKVTRTQPAETVIDRQVVVDVLTSQLVGQLERDGGSADAGESQRYAQGVREGIAAFLELVSEPSWKVTALRARVQQLEQQQEDALALRLDGAIGSRPKGNPRVTIERTAVK